MTIFTTPTRRRVALEELPASMGLFARTSVDYGYYFASEINALERMQEFDEAEADEESPILSAMAARERAKKAGFSFDIPDDGIREGVLDLLMERAYEVRRMDDVMNRRPPGWKGALVGFGASMVGAMEDPVNIALSFIPLVSPAKYARMIAKARGPVGRALVRSRVGAYEGGVGNIIMEPLPLAASAQDQTDYDMGDALLNVALGTAIGGGLHVGIGYVADRVVTHEAGAWREARARADSLMSRVLERTPVEVRRQALRTSIAQAMDGRRINVSDTVLEPVLRSVGGSPTARLAGNVGETGELRASVDTATPTAPPVERPRVLSEGPEIEALRPVQQGIERDYRLATELDVVDDIERLAAEGNSARQTAQRLGSRIDRVDEIAVANNEAAFSQKNKEQLVRSVRSKLGIPSQDEKTEFAAWLAGYNRRKPVNASLDAISPNMRVTYDPQKIADSVRASFLPENKRLVDVELSKAADERIASAPTEDAMPQETLDRALEDATLTAKALGVEDVVTREVADLDELDTAAREYGQAVKAAASCRIRRSAE